MLVRPHVAHRVPMVTPIISPSLLPPAGSIIQKTTFSPPPLLLPQDVATRMPVNRAGHLHRAKITPKLRRRPGARLPAAHCKHPARTGALFAAMVFDIAPAFAN